MKRSKQMFATVTKTQSAQPVGQYARTALDDRKDAADFLLTSLGYIRWKDGRGQYVTDRQLKKLQASHTWATDF
jgi:hypothetical protein